MFQRFDRLLPVAIPLLALLAACEEEVPRPPGAGEVRWPVQPGQSTNYPYETSQYCPDRSIYLAKEQKMSVNDPNPPGFDCWGCLQPADPANTDNVFLTYESPALGFTLVLGPKARGAKTLAELRESFIDAAADWIAKPKSPTSVGNVDFRDFHATVDFIAFNPPTLQLRVHAQATEMYGTASVTATEPYLCSHATPVGGWPTDFHTCTEVSCNYGGTNPIALTAEVTAQITAVR